MVINATHKTTGVEFVSYTGEYPNLCTGDLTLRVNGKEYFFDQYKDRFWASGGSYGSTNDYKDSYCDNGEWVIDANKLPDELKQYAFEIDVVINENIPYGCCGGCL